MSKMNNLTGQKFNRATALKPIYGRKRLGWECICDCGKIFTVDTGYKLTSGHTKSCGCLHSETTAQRNIDNRQFHPSIATAKWIYYVSYSDGDLTFEQFYELSQKNCFYCLVKPSHRLKPYSKWKSNYHNENCEFIYNGLDRINNDEPHNFDNVVQSCKYCNYAKRNLPLDKFYSWIENLYKTIKNGEK